MTLLLTLLYNGGGTLIVLNAEWLGRRGAAFGALGVHAWSLLARGSDKGWKRGRMRRSETSGEEIKFIVSTSFSLHLTSTFCYCRVPIMATRRRPRRSEHRKWKHPLASLTL